MFLLQKIFSLPRSLGNVLSAKINDSMLISSSSISGGEGASNVQKKKKKSKWIHRQESPYGGGK